MKGYYIQYDGKIHRLGKNRCLKVLKSLAKEEVVLPAEIVGADTEVGPILFDISFVTCEQARNLYLKVVADTELS